MKLPNTLTDAPAIGSLLKSITWPVTVVARGGVTEYVCVAVAVNPLSSVAVAEIVKLVMLVGTVKVV